MKVTELRIEPDGNNKFSLYFLDQLVGNDLSPVALAAQVACFTKEADISIIVEETDQTDDGVDCYCNLYVDGEKMYDMMPKEFINVIVDMLKYRR